MSIEGDMGELLRRALIGGMLSWLASPRGLTAVRWAYAEKNNLQLPDEYDQIVSTYPLATPLLMSSQFHDLEPFYALTFYKLQQLRRLVSTRSGMYSITCPGFSSKSTNCTYSIVEKGLNHEGRVVANQRVEAQLSLLEGIEQELEPIEAVFYSHDVPWQFVGHEYVSSYCPGW